MASTMQTEDTGLETPMVCPRNDCSYAPPAVVKEVSTSAENEPLAIPSRAENLNHSQNSDRDIDTTIESQNRTDLEAPMKRLGIDGSCVSAKFAQDAIISTEHEPSRNYFQANYLNLSETSNRDIDTRIQSQNRTDLEAPMTRLTIDCSYVPPEVVQETSTSREHEHPTTPSQANNLKHPQSSDWDIESTFESQNRTDLEAPIKRRRIDCSDLIPAIAPDASTSGHQSPTTPFQADNLSRSQTSKKDLGSTIELQNTIGLRIGISDSTSAIAPDSDTNEQHQPPTTPFQTESPNHSQTSSINTPIEVVRGFSCPLCPNTSIRRDQIKRLRCSHLFHQSCIDMWLSNKTYCPVCRTPYKRIGPHRHKNRKNRRSRRKGRSVPPNNTEVNQY